MIELAIAISVILIVASVSVLMTPDFIFNFLKNYKDRKSIYILAIVVRLLLGVLLIRLANHSLYPTIINFLGLIALIAAVFLLLIGRDNFRKLLSWVLNKTRPFARCGGMLGIIFGVFVLYAFTWNSSIATY